LYRICIGIFTLAAAASAQNTPPASPELQRVLELLAEQQKTIQELREALQEQQKRLDQLAPPA
jgi:hypothetical protein